MCVPEEMQVLAECPESARQGRAVGIKVTFTVYCIIVCCIAAHDIEFAVNVMVVADQLLMSRLKQICESLIVSQLTLDNVTQVYQLASTYNTLQLKVISA